MVIRGKDCDIRIRNCGGVPVVEIVGELNRAALQTVESTIATLASAGHYHIVLNIQRAVAANLKVVETLKDSAERVIKHYGAIDVVAEAGQLRQLLSFDGFARLFRFCTSETEALGRIKRLARRPDPTEQGCSAHVMETK
jgi:hypothetical protein